MGKIKNWDNLDWKTSKKSSKLWVNRHPTATSKFGKPLNRGKVKIMKGRDKWNLVITRSTFKGGEFVDSDSTVRKFDTKEEAREEAVEWMRNHPSG